MAFYDFENIFDSDEWQKKQTWVKRILSQGLPDIVGFQEVFSPDSLEKLVAEQGLPHFATCEAPSGEDDYILNKPVNAIASKFPISHCEAVDATAETIANMQLPADFKFSRAVLRCRVELPIIGSCLVYVMHLKSKRASFPKTDEPEQAVDLNDPYIDIQYHIQQALTRQTQGSWTSTKQRGSEAAIVYSDIVKHRGDYETSNMPVMVLGDFNDEIGSSALHHLVNNHTLWMIEGTRTENLPHHGKDIMDHLTMHDSHDLLNGNPEVLLSYSDEDTPREVPPPKQPTHFFANKGNVLDYILLSNDFNACYQHSIGEITHYMTFDAHLQNPIFEIDSHASDHAMVMIGIELRI
jgi:endonuclease/exonuclease/phosphatase family metal-dependent hydrolase